MSIRGTSRVGAVVLAGGSGSRMGGACPKQFLPLGKWPVICHCLHAFEQFDGVDDVVLVAKEDWLDYCRDEIVRQHGFQKVRSVVAGGEERYDSVYAGLQALKDCDYVMIHDGARPFLTQDILARNLETVKKEQAVVTGMPSKDTVKVADADGFVAATPNRSLVWTIQTPQTFSYPLIWDAYTRLQQEVCTGITDDAMVVEKLTGRKIKLVEGSYRNIKITTPEDLILAEALLQGTKT